MEQTRLHECPICGQLYNCVAFDDHLENDPECGLGDLEEDDEEEE